MSYDSMRASSRPIQLVFLALAGLAATSSAGDDTTIAGGPAWPRHGVAARPASARKTSWMGRDDARMLS